ncbi:MAG: MBL fold metallo-hydrolase [Acidobacteria bacterium]|nr:MBL fold metallo-hydrolase [Acidobacteriota bacterium]MCH8986052.1 MBL fold metallo-hydrolase [Acidobacteriota bacterium]
MTALKLTVLGCGSGGPRPGIAASGYLITAEGASLVLDLGSGTLQPMFELIGGAPDAVVITHRHVDHMADLLGLYGYLSSDRRSGGKAGALRVIAPRGVEEAFAGALQAGEQHPYRDVLAFERPRVGEIVSVGDLLCGFADTVHSVPGIAVRVTCGDSSITYTGDTGPSAAIEELALGCDVLLAEAANAGGRSTRYPFHMTVREAIGMALAAQTSDLVLTHMHSANTSEQVVDAAADVGYTGQVHIAIAGLEMPIDKEKT